MACLHLVGWPTELQEVEPALLPGTHSPKQSAQEALLHPPNSLMPHLMGHFIAFFCLEFQASSSEAPDSVPPTALLNPLLLVGADMEPKRLTLSHAHSRVDE